MKLEISAASNFFSFDTSAIINGRKDLFLPSTFSSVWDSIQELVKSGSVAAVDEVRIELKRRYDDAYDWAKSCTGLFVPLDREVQMAAKEVLASHPRLIGMGAGSRNGADPFVIGLAIAKGGAVVTQELNSGGKNPRIPDVCKDLGVPCYSLPQFVDMQGWVLTRAE